MKPTKVFIHHSLTKDSGSVSAGAIRRYHTEVLGWKNVGYHALIELVISGGRLYYEILMGRMWDEPGAHVRGHNSDSLGLCFIGNYDQTKPEDEMLITGAKLIRLWMRLFDIKINEIYGHRDFSTKSCPGDMFNMNKLKSYIELEL